MSAREVVERMRYRIVVALERRRHRRGTLAQPGRLKEALRRDLQGADWVERVLAGRASVRSRFFASAGQGDRIRQLFETEYRAEKGDTLARAANARAGRFEFFGQQFSYGAEIDWQADPVTGRCWPETFHADVPVHGGDVGYGDVKHVWELSRQQYLVDLAKDHFLTGREESRQAVQNLVLSWIAGNPYATGVNWSCALEPAFRAWSWLWAYHLAPPVERQFHLDWLCGFYDHGKFLATHLEHYSSPYNHLIGEASALYAIGHCFPEFADSRMWCARARNVLERRLHEQFYPDGGSVEQSTFYHHATTGFYLLAGLLARAGREDLSPGVWRAIERSIEFSMQLMQPDGTTPEIGGEDDGKPIRLQHTALWDFRAYQAVGAVVFNRADFKATAGRFYEDALWILGPEGLDRFRALDTVAPSQTAVLLRASGYMVDRSEWSAGADYVCFDVGEQAAGMRPDAVPNSMHGHADCLSIVVWLGGRRVLVDSGLYAYNCEGAWEAHFRETAAHNTARIDGGDQARHIGKMAWSHSYRATIEGYASDGRQSWAIGSHDGYARGPLGVTHRRAVWRRPGRYVLVYDEFVGNGEHDIEVNYQFASGNALQMSGPGRARFGDIAEIVWLGTREWTAQSRCGGAGPADGWICASLGVRHPAPRITLRTRTSGPRASLVTVIAQQASPAQRVSLTQTGPGSLIVVSGESYTDWVAAAGVSEGGPIDTDALLAVCRMEGGREVERLGAGGEHLHVDAPALARLHDSLIRGSVTPGG